MNFKDLLVRAQNGDAEAAHTILELYRPLLLKESIIDDIFDDDLYQELCITLLRCIRYFRIER